MGSFENRRPYPGDNLTGTLNFAANKGTPLGEHLTQSGSAGFPTGNANFTPAHQKNFLGFLRQTVTADGPSLADHVFASGRGELSVPVGSEVGLELSDEFDAGDEFLSLSGTGALSATTAVGTMLGFTNGKVYVSQAAEESFYMLTQQLIPQPGETVRIRCSKR